MDLGCHEGKKHTKSKQSKQQQADDKLGSPLLCDSCYARFESSLPLACPRCGRKTPKRVGRPAGDDESTTQSSSTMGQKATNAGGTTGATQTTQTTKATKATNVKLSMPTLHARTPTTAGPTVAMHTGLASMLEQSTQSPPSLKSLLTGEALPELIFGEPVPRTPLASPVGGGVSNKPRSVQDLVFGKPPPLRTVGDLMESYRTTPLSQSFNTRVNTNTNTGINVKTNATRPLPDLQFDKHYPSHHSHSYVNGKKVHNNDKLIVDAPRRSQPVLNDEGLPVEMFGTHNDALHRLNLEQKYMTRIESPSLRAMMQTGCVADMRESPRCVEEHLKLCHAAFYGQLEKHQLLAKVREGCTLFVLPPPAVVRESGLTRDQLMAHIGRMPESLDLEEMGPGLTLVQTLGARQLQIESRDGQLMVNGLAAKSDDLFPAHILHVPQALDTSEAQVAPADVPDGSATSGGDQEAELSVDKGGSEPPDYPPPVYVEEEQVVSTGCPLSQVWDASPFGHTALRTMVQAMNAPHYNGSIDLSSHQNQERSIQAHPVRLVLQQYDTRRAFELYQADRLPQVLRLAPARRLAMEFRGAYQKHLEFGQGMDMCEYTLHLGTKDHHTIPTRQQLQRGLFSLSFSSPVNPKETTLLLTRLVPSANERNTYMTQNESVVLRFEQDVLHTIAINHKHTMTPYNDALATGHFLHWEGEAPLGLNEDRFDAMLLGEGVVKRMTRRAKKAATKGARKLKGAVQSKQKSVLALRLRPVPNPGVLTSALRGAGSPAPGQMSVTVYDAKMKLLDDDSVQGLATKRYSGDVQVYDVASNSLAAVAQRQGTHVFAVQLGPRKFDLNVDDVSSDTALYYAQDGNQVYLVQFEGVALRRIAMMSAQTGLYVDMRR